MNITPEKLKELEEKGYAKWASWAIWNEDTTAPDFKIYAPELYTKVVPEKLL